MNKQQTLRQYELVNACVWVALPISCFYMLPLSALHFGGGAFIIAWLICCIVLLLPCIILELVQGFSLQATPPEAIRKCTRHWAWLGWWQSCLGLVALAITTLLAVTSWLQCLSFITVHSSGTSGQANFLSFIPMSICGLGLLALTIPFASPDRRYQHRWCMRVAAIGGCCLLIAGVGFLQIPGGSDGLHSFWNISWSYFSQLDMWLWAAGQALLSGLLGCGIASTLASQHPRTSDTTGPASVSCCALVFIQTMLASITASALGCFSYSAHAGIHAPLALTQLPTVFHIPTAAMAQSASLWTIIPFWLGITFFCFLSMHMLVLSLRRHIQNRWPMGHQQANWIIAGLAAIIILPFCHREIMKWIDIAIQSWLIYGIFPSLALSGIFWGWRVKLNGFHDHLTAYSSIRLNDWWPFSISIALPMITIFVIQSYTLTHGHNLNIFWYIATRILPALILLNIAFLLGRLVPKKVQP